LPHDSAKRLVHTHRPYTVNDCEINFAARNPDTYCLVRSASGSPNADCGRYAGKDWVAQLKGLGDAYARFRSNNGVWQKECAAGHCKLNDLGASYAKKAVRFPYWPISRFE
jgi:hypothetical protein